MDEKRFWDILSVGCPTDGNPEDWSDTLEDVLRQLEPSEIAAFDRLFDEKTDAAYSWNLWGAAYLINGGASDDGFYYFLCWLVGMGKTVYEAALIDPDSLADVVSTDQEYEAEIYGVSRGACRYHGLDDAAYDALLDTLRPRRKNPRKPKGRHWDYDDDHKVRRLFPRLAAMYLDNEDRE